jgi:histidyl-tRNA synthetase
MYRSLKGMPDLLPGETQRWQAMEDRLRRILLSFGYAEIRTPYLEETELFARSIGAETDVVAKEMFSFTDKGGDSVTLRPEGTASAIRAYIEHHLGHGNPLVRLYYLGPMFRHERPQKGRFRQFSQVGIEALGSAHPLIDVESMNVLMTIGREFGLADLTLEVSSVGDESCRPAYRAKLQQFLRTKENDLCENCRRRIDTNPLRVFDCKSEVCRNAISDAPLIPDHLCEGCRDHFGKVQAGLRELRLPFTVNPRIVRGLDYYMRTAFEATAGGLGSQNAVGGGGRYDGLVAELGGTPTPGIGFAMGLERLLLSASAFQPPPPPRRFEFIPLDPASEGSALALSAEFRLRALRDNLSATVEVVAGTGSLKSALRQADRNRTDVAVLIGESERAKKTATVKNLAAHTQEEIPFVKLTAELLRRIDGKTV